MMKGILFRLSVVHGKLEDEIRRETKRQNPDDFRLLRLKKLRLAVKDKLSGHWRRQLAVG